MYVHITHAHARAHTYPRYICISYFPVKSSSCTFYFPRLYRFRCLPVHTASLIFSMWKALPSPCRVIARDEQGQQQALPPSAGAKIRNTVTLCNAEDLSHITGAAATEQSDGKGSAAEYAASFKSETAAFFFCLCLAQSDADREAEEEVPGAAATLADELGFP